MVRLQRFVPVGELPLLERKERETCSVSGRGEKRREIVFLFLMNLLLLILIKRRK